MKTCKKCNKEKAFADFKPVKANKDGRAGSCRECAGEVWRAWYNNPDVKAKNAKRNQEFYRSDLGQARQKEKRLARYGLDEATYTKLDQRSGGMCEVCTIRPHECIDHDHDTGEVRGLLCGACNRGLGIFNDTIEGLEAAIRYLKLNMGN